MRLDRDRCVLVLVDYQARLMPSIAGAEAVVREAVFLARVAHALGVPVIGTEQNPDGLGPNVPAVRQCCAWTLAKRHFDACADGLVERLREGGHAPTQVVIAGCEAHVCLLLTALGLREAGLPVAVVPSACGSRSPADQALAMQRLAQAGAVPVAAETLAFEWLRSCDDAAFKAVLQLVKDRSVTPRAEPRHPADPRPRSRLMNDAAEIVAFDARARADGYDQFLDRDWNPGQVVPEHTHPFDARGLVTRGDMWLDCGGQTSHLRVGDGFELAAGTPHAERYGSDGATYRVARRQPAR